MNQIAISGLTLYAFSGWLNPPLNTISLLMIMYALYNTRQQWQLRPCAWIIIIPLALLLLTSTIGLLPGPLQQPLIEAEAVSDWWQLLFFLPVAMLLSQNPQLLVWMAPLAAFGLVIRTVLKLDWSQFYAQISSQHPVGFGMSHVPYAVYNSISLMAVLLLTPVLLQQIRHRIARIGLMLVAIVSSLILIQGSLMAGSRSAWLLGICALLLTSFIYRSLLFKLAHKLWRSHFIASSSVAIGFAMGFILLAYSQADSLGSRFRLQELTQIPTGVIDLDFDKMQREQDAFIVRRLHLYRFALQHASENRFLGQGVGSLKHRLAEDVDFHIHSHVHNQYLNILAEQGVVGLISFTALILAAFMMPAIAVANPQPPQAVRVFLLFSATFAIAAALLDVRYSHSDGRFLMSLLLSMALTGYLTKATEKEQ